ncbi:MAG: M13 family metallopeptidase [Thermoanaerobaculia bacterium]
MKTSGQTSFNRSDRAAASLCRDRSRADFRVGGGLALAVAILALQLFVSGSPLSAAAATDKHGLDLAGMDRAVQPGDDFFAFTNGTWVKKAEIPADRSSFGSFVLLAEEANRRTKELIQEAGKTGSSAAAPDEDQRKVGDYYAAFLDEATIERRGAAPIRPEIEQIAALQDRAALSRYLGQLLRADVDPLNNTEFHTSRIFGLWVSPDLDDPSRNAGYLLQGGIGLPDRDNYVATDEGSVKLQGQYRTHIATLLRLAGLAKGADADSRAAKIYALEAKIAAAHSSRTDSMDVLKAHNRWKLSEFPTRAPGLDWSAFFAAAGLSERGANVADLIVWHPAAVTGIAAIAGAEPLDTWKDYLNFHALDRASALMSKEFLDEGFAFYGKTLFGARELPQRWKRSVDATNAALGDAVGKLYVAKYFPPAAKAAAQEMVRNIVAAFRARVDRLAWMSPATRQQAKAKLDSLYIGIGYTDKWRDYSGLRVARDDAFGNAQRSSLFDYQTAIAKLGKPVDKTEWWMTPQTVNAVNLPLQNALNFPAAILQPPFFDAATDPAQNYGGIGTVIGHEISHSFDDQGSQFDSTGKLANWWTPEDFAHFREGADRLAAQYDAYEPLPGTHLNGKLTLSENIADVAGIAAAYDGYRAFYGGKEGPGSQGFSGDQRFFLSFGQIWRSKVRPEALRSSLLTNGHSPGPFRALTVRNVDAWYEAFSIPDNARLFLAPKDRVRIW